MVAAPRWFRARTISGGVDGYAAVHGGDDRASKACVERDLGYLGHVGLEDLMQGDAARATLRQATPVPARRLHGREDRRGWIQEKVGPVRKEVVGGLGVPGVKAALDLLGLRGGNPRPALRPLPEKDRVSDRRRVKWPNRTIPTSIRGGAQRRRGGLVRDPGPSTGRHRTFPPLRWKIARPARRHRCPLCNSPPERWLIERLRSPMVATSRFPPTVRCRSHAPAGTHPE